MTRRNLRAAGEFSSYPSALKPQCVSKAEKGTDRKTLRGKATKGERTRGREQKMNNRKKRDIMFCRNTRRRGKERVI